MKNASSVWDGGSDAFKKNAPKQTPSHTLLFHLTARKWNSDFAFVFEIT